MTVDELGIIHISRFSLATGDLAYTELRPDGGIQTSIVDEQANDVDGNASQDTDIIVYQGQPGDLLSPSRWSTTRGSTEQRRMDIVHSGRP